MKKSLFAFILLIGLGLGVKAQTYQPNWESIDSRPVPARFEDAKFGIFIHFTNGTTHFTSQKQL